MESLIDRRTFVRRSAVGTAAIATATVATSAAGSLGARGAAPGARETATSQARAPKPPPFKLSLAQWSLHRTIFDKKLDPLDFARTANGLGFDAIEYVNVFWKDKATDRRYLAELKSRARGEGVWSALVMVDGEGALGAADEAKRRQAVENHRKWLEAAAFLGCHSIRVNAQSEGSWDEQRDRAADGLRRLSELGEQYGLDVLVENHGGLSSNGAWLAAVMKAVDHPRCGTLPDFGNFRIREGEEYDRYKGVTELMPFARAVSAKSMAFDRAGNETTIDFARMMKIVAAAGYHGYVGIEYEGKDLPETAGILATKRLLERLRGRP